MDPERNKVLNRMPIKHTGLPDNPVHRKWAVETRQMATRNALIYKAWLKADDKEGAIRDWAKTKKFGLCRQGDIRRILREQRESGAAVALYAAEIESIRQIRSAQVLNAGDTAQAELDELYRHYCDLRDSGHEWVATKIVTKSGDKTEESVETIPIHEAITRVLEMKLRRYKQESEALEVYSGIRATKPYEGAGRARITIDADAAFLSEWNRLAAMKNQPIETEVEVEP